VSNTSKAQSRLRDVRDTFQNPHSPQAIVNSSVSIVAVYDVAWSVSLDNDDPNSSYVAAAGSNGTVLIWNAKRAFLETESTSPIGPPPDAVLNEHARAVNRLKWHPKGTRGLLLTASQDEMVKLWERKVISPSQEANQTPAPVMSWFGVQQTKAVHKEDSFSWHCISTFNPKAEAVRDVSWSPFHDDFFAMVTESGALIIYNINVLAVPWVRVHAHDRGATAVDWHPTKPYVIATGGTMDRLVKIWDIESAMFPGSSARSDTNTWGSSSVSDRSSSSWNETSLRSSTASLGAMPTEQGGLLSGFSSSKQPTLSHILNVIASVTRVAWRPPLGNNITINTHDSMLAVATAPIKGASAGGSGLLSLWSYHRPNMALSVVEGHNEGTVTGFAWLDIPSESLSQIDPNDNVRDFSKISGSKVMPLNTVARTWDPNSTPVMGSSSRSQSFGQYSRPGQSHKKANLNDSSIHREKEVESFDESFLTGTWQHVLSVGRDGRCIIQSFVRGDRPISRVSPSCFAMANLSPFQKGYGSLQIFSVYQDVPYGKQDDFALTGLRQDYAISRAPGVFREPIVTVQGGKLKAVTEKLPVQSPKLFFNVIDQGDLDAELKPVEAQETITVAPEVIHMSRFAELYKLYPDEYFPTRVSLCLHNGSIAQTLNCFSLAQMWRMLAALLKGSGMDQLPPERARASNALQFALIPCVGKLLEDRANAGDVQTCVAICEILQVLQVTPDNVTTCIPGLELNYVREWYLSYIDLLQQMCLFSHATSVIGKCKDPMIGALNQTSTTIHEACPHCGKPLLVGEGENLLDKNSSIVRRSCNSCRRRIGFCFLCHEPVSGVFVWCPGCGHGGHLDHALSWFGGRDGKPVREMCPTGCGHRCNLSQQFNSLPPPQQTESSLFRCFPIAD
jgi:WD repeat-containing protein 24